MTRSLSGCDGDAEINFEPGYVLPLVFRNGDRGFDRSVQVRRYQAAGTSVRKLFHCSNDPADIIHALEGCFQSLRNLFTKKVELAFGGYDLGFFQETRGFTIHDVAGAMAILAAVSVIYGAIVTIRQDDMKRLIAYSSVSHMGFVLLGVAAIGASKVDTSPAGLNGAALQMFTHGTITGLAFLMVGLSYDRTHTRHIPHLGGLWKRCR